MLAAPEGELTEDQQPEVIVTDEPTSSAGWDAEQDDDEGAGPDFGAGAGSGLRQALYERGRRFLNLLLAARDELSPEVVHQLRVNARRLEGGLHLLVPLLGKKTVGRTREVLGVARRSVGELRDLQRQLEALADEPLLDDYLAERSQLLPRTLARAGKELRKCKPGKIEKRLELVDALLAARLEETGEEVARQALEQRVWESLLSAMERAEHVDPDHSDSYHELRIALKRFRYQAEFFAATGWPQALDDNDGWDRLKELHHNLGALQDLEVLCRHLDVHWAESPPIRETQARLVNTMLKQRNGLLHKLTMQDVDWESFWHWTGAHQEAEAAEAAESE